MRQGQDYWTSTVPGAAAFARLSAIPVSSAFDDYSPEAAEVPERTEENACPECETGVIFTTGREYGQDLYACSHCKWTS